MPNPDDANYHKDGHRSFILLLAALVPQFSQSLCELQVLSSIDSGRRLLSKDRTMVPTKALTWDPCPLGLAEEWQLITRKLCLARLRRSDKRRTD